MKDPVVIATIGDLIDHDHGLNGHCTSCGRTASLDLAALAARLGRDRSYLGRLPVRCSACGSRAVQITVDGTGWKARA